MKSALQNRKLKLAETAIAAPVDAQEFAALMESCAPFAAPLRLAAAVSGGPDSMALAFCAKRWLGETKGGTLIALIVDHGLRDGSAAEAEQAQKTLAAIGIASEILRWTHPPIIARLHEVARKARYRLLSDACRRHDIGDLLFAHQREDQAETVLMRLAKGSGIDGLAGMPAQSVMDGVRILRPCLNIPRERLAATCGEAGLSFAVDPSNGSEKFARGRLRRVMPLLAAEGLTVDRLCDLGVRAAEAKAALDHATAMLLGVAARLEDSGALRVDLEHLRSAPRAIALRALGACLQTVHPQDHAPEHASLARLLDRLAADSPMPSSTLHGCYIGKNGRHAVVMREYAAITDMPLIKPGESVLWDRRWRITLKTPLPRSGRGGGPFACEAGEWEGEGLMIRPLGNPPHDVLDRLAPGLRRQVPQGHARASLPSLWLNGTLALMPALPRSIYDSGATASLGIAGPPDIRQRRDFAP